MPTEIERQRGAAIVLAVERLVSEMKAQGEADPIGVLRAAQLLLSLTDAVELPLLQVDDDPAAVRWAPEVQALLITFDVGDGVLVRRLFAHAVEIVALFQPAHA